MSVDESFVDPPRPVEPWRDVGVVGGWAYLDGVEPAPPVDPGLVEVSVRLNREPVVPGAPVDPVVTPLDV